MHSYIIIHNTHETFEVALFLNNTLYDSITDDKRLASKMIITHIDHLLKKNNIQLTKLNFIGINQGPGLFSLLRSIISTVNGIHFATHIPLIGIDALDATAHEFYDKTYPYSVVLLEAFNHEVYYAISKDTNIIAKGYNNSKMFLDDLFNTYPSETIRFIGKGAQVYKDLILETGKQQAIIHDQTPEICSLGTIATLALDKFKQKKIDQEYLYPLHLKKHPVELL